MTEEKPQIISRKQHYSYVLVFSVALWLFVAMAISGFIPYHILGGDCEKCTGHLTIWNISPILFALGGIIAGLAFSFPFHRIMYATYSKPHDKELRLSWMARYGKGMISWRILVVIFLIFDAYVIGRMITPEAEWVASTRVRCAVLRNDTVAITKELEKGYNIQYALTQAAEVDSKSIASLLITKGADVNARGYHGEAPLHWTGRFAGKEVAELLVNNGADVNAKDKKGSTPLHWAVGFRNFLPDVIKLLIKNGANINSLNDLGETPLDIVKSGKKNVSLPKEREEYLRFYGAKTGEELGTEEDKE